MKRGGLERVLVSLQKPRFAAALLVAGLALALLLPVLLAYLHLNMLEARIAKAESFLAESAPVITIGSDDEGEPLAVLTLKEQLAIYSELDQTRLPMAKLLADLSAGLPATDRDRLTLVRDLQIEGGEFSVRGIADSGALVPAMTRMLNQSNVFAGVSAPSTQALAESGGVEFTLEGLIARPYFAPTYPADVNYEDQNLAEKIYNEDGAEIWRRGAPIVNAMNRSGTGAMGASTRPTRNTSGSGRSTSRPVAGDSSSSSGSGGGTEVASASGDGASGSDARTERRDMFQGGSRSGGEEAPPPIPEPLTDEEIAALGQQEAMREMVNRRRASGQEGIADDVKRRLEEETTKLRNRAREAQQEGGGA